MRSTRLYGSYRGILILILVLVEDALRDSGNKHNVQFDGLP